MISYQSLLLSTIVLNDKGKIIKFVCVAMCSLVMNIHLSDIPID